MASAAEYDPRVMTCPSEKNLHKENRPISIKIDISFLIVFLGFFLLGLPLSGELPQPPRLIRDIEIEAGPPSLTEYLIWGTIYAFALILAVKHSAKLNNARAIVILLPIIYYLISVFFSPHTPSPLPEALQLLGSTAFALLTARKLSVDFCRSIRVVQLATTANLFINVLFIFAIPEATISEDGRWSSLSGNPNYLGAIALVNIFLLMTLSVARKTRYIELAFLAALPLAVLVGTRSATATGTLIFLVFTFLFFSSHRLGRIGGEMVRSGLFFVLLILILFLSIFANTFLDILGKDITLTGRTVIWERSFKELTENWGFGFGIGVTTLDVGATNWATHFHNGFLQILMYMGSFGLLLFIIPLVSALIKAIHLKWRGELFFVFGGLTSFMIYNLSEVGVFLWRNPLWLLYLSVMFFQGFKLARDKN